MIFKGHLKQIQQDDLHQRIMVWKLAETHTSHEWYNGTVFFIIGSTHVATFFDTGLHKSIIGMVVWEALKMKDI